MIKAELRYNCVANSAFQYAQLLFHGDESIVYTLDQIINLITYDKSEENTIKLEHLKVRRQSDYLKWTDKEQEIDNFKKEHLLWQFSGKLRKEMQGLQEEHNELAVSLLETNVEISSLQNDLFHDATYLREEYKNLLRALDFSCRVIRRGRTGNYAVIYESAIPDKELQSRAEELLQQKTIQRQEELTDLRLKYNFKIPKLDDLEMLD